MPDDAGYRTYAHEDCRPILVRDALAAARLQIAACAREDALTGDNYASARVFQVCRNHRCGDGKSEAALRGLYLETFADHGGFALKEM
jgi:hypothetical protein